MKTSLGMGVGLGFAFLPLHGIVAKHFTRRRSLALGIITTGTSLGGFTFSVLVSKLLNSSLGFPWTVRVSAFITLGCILLGNILMSEPKVKEHLVNSKTSNTMARETKGHLSSSFDVEASNTEERPRSIPQLLRDPVYLAIISSGFIAGLGLYFPM